MKLHITCELWPVHLCENSLICIPTCIDVIKQFYRLILRTPIGSRSIMQQLVFVRRAGLLLSQQDFEWR